MKGIYAFHYNGCAPGEVHKRLDGYPKQFGVQLTMHMGLGLKPGCMVALRALRASGQRELSLGEHGCKAMLLCLPAALAPRHPLSLRAFVSRHPACFPTGGG